MQNSKIQIKPRVIELKSGDIISCSVDCFMKKLEIGDIYNFQKGTAISSYLIINSDVKGKLIKIIKEPQRKKWYQFWITPRITEYYFVIL